MAAPWKMATAIFSFGCKTFKSLGAKAKQNHQPTQDDGRHPEISVNPSSILQPVLAK